ncbi:MAG: DUF192 domain-containing protein [Planctomycetota bacterium]|jgi:uncharacterized membrane protein (UPF0127 family)
MIDSRRVTEGAAVRPTGILSLLLVVAAITSGCGEEGSGGRWVEIRGRRWNVRLALTEEEHRVGLAGVRHLSENEGMLFVFDHPAVHEFWMRGCLIPLDVAFIDGRMRVVAMHTMQVEKEPDEVMTYSSHVPVLYALEVRAGELADAGVRIGDVVSFSRKVCAVTKGGGKGGRLRGGVR